MGAGFNGGGDAYSSSLKKRVTALGKIGCMVNYENICIQSVGAEPHMEGKCKHQVCNFVFHNKGGTAEGEEIISSC